MNSLWKLYSFSYRIADAPRGAGALQVVLQLLLGCSALLWPYMTGHFYSRAEYYSRLIAEPGCFFRDPYILGLLAGAAAIFMLQVAVQYVSAQAGVNSARHIYSDVMQKLFHLPPDKMAEMSFGDIQMRFWELDKIYDSARQFIGTIGGIATIAAGMTYVVAMSPWLLLLLAPLPGIFFHSELVKHGYGAYLKAHREAGGRMTGGYIYSLKKYRDIANMRANGRIVARNMELREDFLAALLARFLYSVRAGAARNALLLAASACSGIMMLVMLNKGLVTVAEMVSFGVAVALMRAAVQSISAVYQQRREYELQLEYYEYFLKLPVMEVKTGGAPCAVELANIWFSYPGGKALFCGVGGKFKPGIVNVLTGGNGAGKSTLFGILNGTYSASCGAISDGREGKLCHGDVIYIGADDHCFYTGSIAEDMSLMTGRPQEEARRLLSEFGFDCELSARRGQRDSADLSTGQKKLLAVLRGVLLDPPVLLLDEPFANLSAPVADKVARCMSKLKGIVVLSTHVLPNALAFGGAQIFRLSESNMEPVAEGA